jgi:hypothetical protein
MAARPLGAKASAPDFRSYRPWPENFDGPALAREMADEQKAKGATFFRFTWFDAEHPSEVYPQGLYVEGWRVQPDEQPPFAFPLELTATGKGEAA